jgi:glycerol-3-phosphate dehydrogenase
MPRDNKLIAVIGGGATGCNLSLTLANQDNHVLIFEALDNAAGNVEPISRIDLLDRIEKEAV